MKCNLENINFYREKQMNIINSPRSKEALNRLLFDEKDFYFISFDNFLNKYYNIKDIKNKELYKINYDIFEKKRIEKLDEARKLRRKIIDNQKEEENQKLKNDNNIIYKYIKRKYDSIEINNSCKKIYI
jgi:hypothetical protein